MDIVFEALVDLFLEGTFELTKNKKVSKWIRYPLMVIISLIFAFIIGLVFLLSYALFNQSKIISLLLFGVGIFFLIGTIYKLRKVWKEK